MRKILLILILHLLSNFAFTQNKQEAEKIVYEGIAYHDKGDYDGAISKYDRALELDKNNLFAMTEKALSLLSLNKLEESIRLCKKSIEQYPNDKELKTVFVTYGNALDGLKNTDKSIEIYDEGIRLFPEYYQLYYNKGISLSSVRKYDESLLCFQKAVLINPKHASSNNAIARILYSQGKNIPSLLAFSRFLILEPQSKRAKENLELLEKISKANVKQTGENSISINLDSKMLMDTAINGKEKENNFRSTELILSMTSALDFDKKNSNKTDVEKFIRKFETVCASVDETKESNFGFYWDYYVPFFIEMNKKKLLETFAYIAFASSDKENISEWLKSHQTEIDKFYEWSKNYNWDKK
jgi:tetratricopeptide (TPR) repeat protein